MLFSLRLNFAMLECRNFASFAQCSTGTYQAFNGQTFLLVFNFVVIFSNLW